MYFGVSADTKGYIQTDILTLIQPWNCRGWRSIATFSTHRTPWQGICQVSTYIKGKAGLGRSLSMLVDNLSRTETMSRRSWVFASSCISENLQVHEANNIRQFPSTFCSLHPLDRGLQRGIFIAHWIVRRKKSESIESDDLYSWNDYIRWLWDYHGSVNTHRNNATEMYLGSIFLFRCYLRRLFIVSVAH